MRALLNAFAVLFSMGIFFSSCAGVKPYVNPTPFSAVETVRLWIEPYPDADPKIVMEGCRYWASKGVVCKREAASGTGAVKVLFSPEPCVSYVDEAGGTFRTVACADAGKGTITFTLECFRFDGAISAKSLRTASGHEIGHMLGLGHVERDCDRAPTLPDGRKICGDALMNHASGADFVTDQDSAAFDMRHEPIPTGAPATLPPTQEGEAVRHCPQKQ